MHKPIVSSSLMGSKIYLYSDDNLSYFKYGSYFDDGRPKLIEYLYI